MLCRGTHNLQEQKKSTKFTRKAAEFYLETSGTSGWGWGGRALFLGAHHIALGYLLKINEVEFQKIIPPFTHLTDTDTVLRMGVHMHEVLIEGYV